MKRYAFNKNDSELIVNAIVEGYRDYIEHRKERKGKMAISSAFAWTKGNFIESRMAEESTKLNYSFQIAKAGLTWDYLQFKHLDTKKLFLIKNAAYFNANSFSHALLANKKNSPRRTYLHELSKINQGLYFSDTNSAFTAPVNKQLSLFVLDAQIDSELEKMQSTYQEFHILTYEIDEAYQISKIMHYLPNPEDNIAYVVDDLSDFIQGAELTDEEREIVAPEQDHDIVDPIAFDIGIFTEEEEN